MSLDAISGTESDTMGYYTTGLNWCAVVARGVARQLRDACEEYYDSSSSDAPAPAAEPPLEEDKNASSRQSEGMNTLLALWRERTLEALDLLSAGGVASSSAYDAVLPPTAKSQADEEPPAPPLIKKWRKMDREWPCWSLAFAVPSEAALQVLSQHSPIVEMGAGTGYWVHILQRRGIQCVAYDARPNAEALGAAAAAANGGGGGGGGGNEFHGDCPSFTDVKRGGPNLLSESKWSNHTLLLCYPPPNKPMGYQAVNAFCGQHVIHVGEWRGDTGDTQLEKEFGLKWDLVLRLPLPNWGDTAEDLTVWRRKKEPLPPTTTPLPHPVLRCDACGQRLGTVPLRRCRYCRTACYCSSECASKGADARAALHKTKMITIQRPLDFEGRDYYALEWNV